MLFLIQLADPTRSGAVEANARLPDGLAVAELGLKIGRFRIPLRKPELRLLRKSRPFWSLLGDKNVWSTVLRVPITFPPERMRGVLQSANCLLESLTVGALAIEEDG